MAIRDVAEYAHLSEADVEEIGRRLDELQDRIRASLGERDARYIRNVIKAQRTLEILGRATLMASHKRAAWWTGASLLGLGKIIENMEIGHNVMHGQWDWMNDPEIHSANWEWDNHDPAKHWKVTHNYLHHKYTNVLGMDDDIGYGLIRVTRDQKWKPFNAGNLVYNVLLMLLFQWGVAAQHLELGKVAKGRVPKDVTRRKLREVGQKMGRQLVKDYALFPALAGKRFKTTFTANMLANVIRNVWTDLVIFCGHFPDGAEKFTKADVDSETRAQWYMRQMLGSANITGGRVIDFLTGNLSLQIEHHLFPDMPSIRLREASKEVRAICQEFDLPYTEGALPVQVAKTWRTVAKMSFPNHWLIDTTDDAPETASEQRFVGTAQPQLQPGHDRAGLDTHLHQVWKGHRRRALVTAIKRINNFGKTAGDPVPAPAHAPDRVSAA